MTSELIKCPHCGYKYHIDLGKIVEDGETVAVRSLLSGIKNAFSRKTPQNQSIDLVCANCKKEFEWEVKV